MSRHHSLPQDKGFTLIEVLIGLILLAFGLLALMALELTSIRGTAFSSSLTQASVHAQEGLENLKRLPLYKVDGVTVDDPFTAGFHNDTDIGSFKRQYTIESAAGYVTIRYTVSWTEKGVNHSATFDLIKAR